MVTAFVLIHVEHKHLGRIAEDLLKLEGVTEIHVVAGEYDMVAVLRVSDNRTLSELITQKIVHTPGIDRTKTLFALESYSHCDLNSLFGVDKTNG